MHKALLRVTETVAAVLALAASTVTSAYAEENQSAYNGIRLTESVLENSTLVTTQRLPYDVVRHDPFLTRSHAVPPDTFLFPFENERERRLEVLTSVRIHLWTGDRGGLDFWQYHTQDPCDQCPEHGPQRSSTRYIGFQFHRRIG